MRAITEDMKIMHNYYSRLKNVIRIHFFFPLKKQPEKSGFVITFPLA